MSEETEAFRINYEKREVSDTVGQLSPELVARMVAFVRRMSECYSQMADGRFFSDEARAICADPAFPPKSVDADLVEVRKLFAERDGNKGYQYLDGSRDEYDEVAITLAAFRRGRQLEREGR